MTDTETTYVVKRTGKILKPEFDKKEFTVDVDNEKKVFSCCCKKMTRDGIQCSHVLRIVVHLGLVHSMPESFVNPRWKRSDPKEITNYVFRIPEGSYFNTEAPIRHAIEVSRFSKICSIACTNDISYKVLQECMKNMEKKVNASIIQYEQNATANKNETVNGDETSNVHRHGVLKDPPILKTKGRRKGQRMKAGSEIKRRKCGECGKRGHTKPDRKSVV